MKDFLRKTETGDLDYDRIVEIVRELAAAAALHSGHNILLDLRETKVSVNSMYEVMKVAMEFSQFKTVFRNKIANVIPNDIARISMAKKAEAAFQIKGIQYKFFTDFEDAIEWLSEKIDLNQLST